MVRTEGICLRLGNFALRDISIMVPEGYITGLIGPNGAGKTSLLYLLLGLYQPDAGSLKMFGKSYPEAEKEIRNRTGYVLAEELFCRGLSLLDNADMYGRYYEAYDRQKFAQYCERFELDSRKKLGKVSKGERMKFQFAFALSHTPRLLLLDEPMANFDPHFRDEFLRIVTEFVADGKHSCLIATHLTGDLERIADYVIMLKNGKIVFSEEKEQLFEQYRMIGGENYKINLVPKEKVIGKEAGECGTKALVRHNRFSVYDKELTVSRPTLEEIMYYTVKGEAHVKNGFI